MATLTQFRAELAAVLGLDNTASGDQTFMDQYINEGVSDVMLKVRFRVRPFEMALTADEGDYTLTTDILAIIDLIVTSQSSDYSLARVTPSDILDMRRNAAGSSPARYYAVAGSDLLMVYPTPDAADTLTGLYVPRPATLTAGADTPSEIPAEWHKLVSLYALYRCADMDDDSSSDMGERYRALYENGIREARKATYTHGGIRMPAVRRRVRRGMVESDPSVSTAY